MTVEVRFMEDRRGRNKPQKDNFKAFVLRIFTEICGAIFGQSLFVYLPKLTSLGFCNPHLTRVDDLYTQQLIYGIIGENELCSTTAAVISQAKVVVTAKSSIKNSDFCQLSYDGCFTLVRMIAS